MTGKSAFSFSNLPLLGFETMISRSVPDCRAKPRAMAEPIFPAPMIATFIIWCYLVYWRQSYKEKTRKRIKEFIFYWFYRLILCFCINSTVRWPSLGNNKDILRKCDYEPLRRRKALKLIVRTWGCCGIKHPHVLHIKKSIFNNTRISILLYSLLYLNIRHQLINCLTISIFPTWETLKIPAFLNRKSGKGKLYTQKSLYLC